MSGPASATSKQCAGPPPRPRLRRLATWSRLGWATWTLGTERGCCPHTTRRQCLINRRASSWPWAVSAALSRPPPDCDSGRSMTPRKVPSFSSARCPSLYSVLRVCLRPKMNQTSSTTKHGSLKKSPSPSFQFGLRILGLRKNESQACWSSEPTGETPKPAPVSGRHTRSPSRPRANPTVPLERDTVPSLQDLAAPRSESSVPSGPFQLSSDI